MLAFRLFVDEDAMGALNLYSKASDAFDDESRELGAVFAAHAAVARCMEGNLSSSVTFALRTLQVHLAARAAQPRGRCSPVPSSAGGFVAEAASSSCW